MIRWTILLSMIQILSGCSFQAIPENIPIRGKVTFLGEPLTGGEVLYSPVEEGAGRRAYGKIAEDGTFTLQTGVGIPGVVPGNYLVAILAGESHKQDGATSQAKKRPHYKKSELASRQPEKLRIPQRYFDAKQSGLTDEVGRSHKRYVEFALTD